jgi:hypothetical protein
MFDTSQYYTVLLNTSQYYKYIVKNLKKIASPRDSLYSFCKKKHNSISKRLSIFFLYVLELEILVKKCPPTSYLNGHPNITIFYFGFFASQIYNTEWLSRVCIRNRKVVGNWKDIENDFYANGSLTDHRKTHEDALTCPFWNHSKSNLFKFKQNNRNTTCICGIR